jgi:ribonuclease PH
MNSSLTGEGEYIEVQGTAEAKPFSKGDLDRLADLAAEGISRLTTLQREILG